MNVIMRIFQSQIFAGLLSLACGILVCISDYPNPVAFLAWVAPVPVLAVALRRGFPNAWWMGLLYVTPAYFASGVLTMPGFIPLPIRIGYLLAYIILFEFVFVTTVYLVRRTGLAASGWVHAAVVTAAGLVQEIPYIGHFLPAASTQAYCHLSRFMAALGGDYLIAFSIYLFTGSLAALILERRRAVVASAVAGFLTVAAFMAGGMLWTRSVEHTGQVRVAAIVCNYTEEMARRVWHENIGRIRSADTWRMFDEYERLTRKAAAGGARIISWPEYGLWVLGDDMEEFTRRVEGLARDTNAVVAAGYIDVKNSGNCVLLAGPGGERLVYFKHHLAPGSETPWQRRGERPFGMLHIAALGMNLSVRICADNDFSAGNRQAAREGAHLFIAPSADSTNMAERHAMAHVLRAAENGIPIIRATLGGVSVITGPNGGIVQMVRNITPGRSIVIAGNVPVVSARTPYVHLGNWIIAVSALILIGLTAASCRKRKQ